jgi:carbon storage regulator CsrA
MLVLSRKTKETIVLPSLGISVQVLGIQGGRVRLGIDAPPEIPIRRGELPDWKDDEAVQQARLQKEAQARRGRVGPGVGLKDDLAATGLGLGLVRLQLDAGRIGEAKETLASVQQRFQAVLKEAAEKSSVQQKAHSLASPKRRKALIVEDNSNERELLACFLRQSGLEVDTAGDGSDALDYLHTHRKPDMVLLDMGLPRLDGPTAVREIRRDPAFAGLKIFGVTGRLPEEFHLDCGPRGVDRWFCKPLDPASLIRDLTEEMEPTQSPDYCLGGC